MQQIVSMKRSAQRPGQWEHVCYSSSSDQRGRLVAIIMQVFCTLGGLVPALKSATTHTLCLRTCFSFLTVCFPHSRYTYPHGKVEHKARSILDPALYSERYIKQTDSKHSSSPVNRQDWRGPFDTLLVYSLPQAHLTICSLGLTDIYFCLPTIFKGWRVDVSGLGGGVVDTFMILLSSSSVVFFEIVSIVTGTRRCAFFAYLASNAKPGILHLSRW